MNASNKIKNPFGKNRFNSYRDYVRHKYGERVQKVTVDAGFTCPNRDGTVAKGGCIYCNNESFNPSYNNPSNSIGKQIKQGISFLKSRYNVSKFIVYFQPYSNTYASLDGLKKKFEEALSFPEVIGLTIGTRPDCIDEGKINYLHELSSSFDITIEYGLESIYNESLKRINRGHDYQSFIDAINMTKGKGIKICTHLILGFPWENKNEWLHEAKVLSALPIDFMKIHQLHIVKDTVMAKQYEVKPFKLLGYSEYIDIIVSFLERLNSAIIMQRLCAEAPPNLLIAPLWGKRNAEILNAIKTELSHRDSWQGKYYQT